MFLEEKHKGYGFVTFSSTADAQDAIDNMDLNELRGKVLRVNLARPTKIPLQPQGNKASEFSVIRAWQCYLKGLSSSLGIRRLAPAVR